MVAETSKTLEKALSVLRAFGRATPAFSVADLARRLDESRTAITRILVTLEQAGFVERDEAGLYRVGLTACEVGALYLGANPLATLAGVALADLALATGCTAYVGALSGPDVVILGVREGSRPIRFIWSVGDRLPVATTAVGKAILMELSPTERDGIVGRGPLPGLTSGSLRSRADLDEQIAQYRPKGWIPMVEESCPGICAVGAPVLSAEGKPSVGLSLSFIGTMSDTEQFERLGRLVLEAARTVSRKVRSQAGYSGLKVEDSARSRPIGRVM